MKTGKSRRQCLLFGLLVLGSAAAYLAVRWHFTRPQAWQLADGTVVYFRSGMTIKPAAGFPHPRSLMIDGDGLVVETDAAAGPLIVHTRLMTLAFGEGAAARITANARDSGEQVQVIRGRVVAQKAYRSRDEESVVLGSGEMVMVNQSIDLMEKERDTPELTRKWSEAIARAAGLPKTWP